MNNDNERLTLREVQLEELNILLKVTEFLDANNIHYCLCGGTLLGAVRHGGFIPWDDDIDVLMFRKDFEKLRDIVKEQRPLLDGVVFHLPGDKGYIYPFIKAVNPSIIVDYGKPDDKFLWVDIFPMDHFPDSKLMHWLCLQKILWFVRALSMGTYSDENMRQRGYYDSFTRKIKMNIARFLYKFFGGYEKISRRIDTIAQDMDRKYKDSQHVGDAAWPNGMNDYYRKDWIIPSGKMLFEGHEFSVPGDYDAFLRGFFGDYMTLPPEDKRQTHYLKAYRAKP